MNEIQRLIQEMCPDGVPMVALGEVAIRNKGINITAGQMQALNDPTGDILVYAAGNTKAIIKKEYLPDNCAITQPSVIVKSRGNVGFEYYEKPFTHKNEMWSYSAKKKLNIKYLYYIFDNLVPFFRDKARNNSVKLPQLCVADTDNYRIPLPPLPIQQRIVEILDKFTSLVSSLDSEIALRQKQYEYYRNKFLTFEEGEAYKRKLGDIASFKYGYTGVAKDEGQARYVRITDITPDGNLQPLDGKYIETINEDNKIYLLNKGDLLVARIGATFGKTLFYDEDYPSLYASFLIKITFKDNSIDSRYYWQFSKSYYYWTQANKLVGGGAQPQFNANALCDVVVPIPSLDKQHSIVRTLDTFESLLTNLKKERALRQKQYEYYREKLLTFA